MSRTFEISEISPHGGKMRLLDRVCDWGDDWISAEIDIHEDSLFAENRGVPAWIALEYMAQAIAAHSGLLERLDGGEPQLGFLLGTRKLELPVHYFPLGSTLRITARREFQADNGLGAFRCTLESNGVEMSTVLNVFQPEDPQAFLSAANTRTKGPTADAG